LSAHTATAGSAASGVALAEHLGETLRWHFDPATGSPFWLRKAAELGFDPCRDLHEFAGLRRFPDVSDELRTVGVDDLIPAGCAGEPFGVYESGGTLGAPKRIVESDSRLRGVDWVSQVLRSHGFPDTGHWLHVGPTGPHIVGRSVRRLAELRRSICFTVDFDPRWVKRLIGSGRHDVADDYVQHVLDQVELIAANQEIRILFITPPMLEALCGRTELHDRLAARIDGLIWSGTSMSATTLRLVEETFFPQAKVVGIYGNSLMGIAPQRPPREGDEHRCVFQTFWPNSIVEVVDPETGQRVPYGERGRVLVHLLTRDLFLPNVVERDTAVRLPAAAHGEGDDLADIRPYRASSATVIEGVY
jgi:hypothetical protein